MIYVQLTLHVVVNFLSFVFYFCCFVIVNMLVIYVLWSLRKKGSVLYVCTKFQSDSSLYSNVIRGPKILKLGHVTRATPTYGSFYIRYARRVRPPYVAPCGLPGCKNGPALFPGRMSYKATKPGLVFVLYLSMFFLLCWCLLGPLFVYC